MKPDRLIKVVFTLLFLFGGPLGLASPPAISYSGGDGSSLEKAVIIKGATEETGVRAEYSYIEKHYPGFKRGAQSLQNSKGRMFDAIEFTTADGKKKTIYFDITDFFGKL